MNRDLLLRLADWASGFSVWESPVPWWAWLGTLPLLLVVSWLAVRRTPTPLWLRVVAPALTAALMAGGFAAVDRADRDNTARVLGHFPVTFYLPRFPGTTFWQVGPSGDVVTLYYQAADPISFPTVHLIGAAGRTTCETANGPTVLGLDELRCAGDEFTSAKDGYHAVVLRRGDTVLVASDRDDGLSSEVLLTGLRTAAEVSAQQLADAAKRP